MEIRDNDAPGKSVILVKGDSLEDVPASHRDLLTPQIVEAFADPTEYFKRIERACPFKSMSKWLRALLKENKWELGLHRGVVLEHKLAGFRWYSNKVTSVTIALPKVPPPETLPEVLRTLYSLVDELEWAKFAYAGGFYSADTDRDLPLAVLDNPRVKDLPQTVKAFGSNAGGDELVYAADGRAGWRDHENGRVFFQGNIEKTINWVFDMLGKNQLPF